MKNLLVVFVLSIFFHAKSASGNDFVVRLSADYGFTSKTVKLTDHEVSDIQSLGFSIGANYNHSFYFPNVFWSLGLGARYHYLNAVTSTSELAGSIADPYASLGLGCRFLVKNTVLFNIKAAPNRLWDDFRNETTDLLRYNLEGIYARTIYDNWSITAGFQGLIYPRLDMYRINHPSYALSVGVQYNFRK